MEAAAATLMSRLMSSHSISGPESRAGAPGAGVAN